MIVTASAAPVNHSTIPEESVTTTTYPASPLLKSNPLAPLVAINELASPFFLKITPPGSLPVERTFKKTIEGADCLLVTVGHNQFKRLKLEKIKLLTKKHITIVDIAHVINPVKAEKEGFVYRGVGRGIWTK